MESNLLKCWKQNKPVVNGWCAIPSFFSAELMSRQGWDTVTIDMQHGLVGYDTLLPMLAAMDSNVTPLARVPWLEPGIIMKSLDAGCLGIICPMVNTEEDAERFVQAMRYPPRGGRSFGPTRAVLRHGPDYPKEADKTCVAFAMIETREALDNIDGILKTEGLDAIYVGPADLSNSLGHNPQLDPTEPEVVEAIDMALAKAKENNLHAGIHTGSGSYCLKMIEKGFDFTTIMSDARLLSKACQDALSEVRASAPQETGGIY